MGHPPGARLPDAARPHREEFHVGAVEGRQRGQHRAHRLAGHAASASVSALCFANECSTYFQVGKVCKDQIVEYAERKGQKLEETEKWMGPYLGYDPDSK